MLGCTDVRLSLKQGNNDSFKIHNCLFALATKKYAAIDVITMLHRKLPGKKKKKGKEMNMSHQYAKQ